MIFNTKGVLFLVLKTHLVKRNKAVINNHITKISYIKYFLMLILKTVYHIETNIKSYLNFIKKLV